MSQLHQGTHSCFSPLTFSPFSLGHLHIQFLFDRVHTSKGGSAEGLHIYIWHIRFEKANLNVLKMQFFCFVFRRINTRNIWNMEK